MTKWIENSKFCRTLLTKEEIDVNFYLAEVNMQCKVVIYFFLAGTSISNEMPNF